MNDTPSLIFFIVIALIISMFIGRWIFRINEIVGYLRMQTGNQKVIRKLVVKMAERSGMTEEEIKTIIDESSRELH